MRYLTNRNIIFRIKTQTRIKISPIFANAINHPDKLVYYCYHRLFIALKFLLFAQKILSEIRFPGYYSYCHLKKNVSKPRTSLLGYVFIHPKLARLFYYWVCASIFYEFLCTGKSKNIFYFSDKMKLYLLILIMVYFFKEHIFEFLDSWFKEETLFDVEDEGLRKAVVVDTDGVFSKVYDVLRGEGRSSTFGGRR